MGFRLSFLLLALAAVVVFGQKKRVANKEWSYRDGSEKVSMRGVANLTQVLDDWKFGILSQVKDILQKDHQNVLPDYARIQPLSEALDDLYKEFNALKSHLGELTDKFTAIESFIDDLKINKEKEKANTPAPVTPVRRRLIKTRTSASSSS
ncbi:uncharacterized protein Hap1MRO34_018515 [Clarias gariepinus]|uniref:uncharacterized protein si:ch211-76l23.4 n=1 Tax=Clarias gariepinus TaxID=13013 RepID=UPI00234C5B9D|nr:uncharacterized protein si:ch211-76l23.4 [Clarias gariepinus]